MYMAEECSLITKCLETAKLSLFVWLVVGVDSF
jgi:hypothetical protein